jgi:hypothetical protein
LQSQDFTTTWAATNIAVSGNTTGTTDPFGTNLADLLTATASGSARVVQTFSFVSGTTYTYSCFAKAGNGFFGMTMENGGVASGVAVVWNVSTGAFSVSGSIGSGYTLQAHNIENYGNGWYRCSMRVLLGSTVTGNIRVNTSNGTMSSVVIQSDNGNSVNVFGAQVETGSVATSYIPTTAAPVTRNADVINLSGAVSGCIGQTDGTVYFEVEVTDEARDKWICTLDSAATSYIQIAIAANRTILVSSLNAGSTVISSLISSALSVGYHKVAFAYNTAASGCIMYIDGAQNPVAVRTVTGSGLPALNNFSLGNFRTSVSDNLKARIRAAALYTTRLTNAELAALTT